MELDAITMMVTFAQKGGESHTREVTHVVHEATFQSYSTAKAGTYEDSTHVKVMSTIYLRT